MTTPVVFPPGPITPLGEARMQAGIVPEIDFVGADGTIVYLQGGKAPDLSCEDGFGLLGHEGLQPPFDLLDEQGARQDGVTNLDTVFDPAIIKLTLEASGVTPQSMRRAIRIWISSWNPPNVGTLSVFTQELGQWWMPVRQHKPIPDKLTQDPSLHRRLRFEWECRGDNSFWQGVDSLSTFELPTGATSGNGWCPLTNLGTRPAWPRFLVYGPGTFTLGNGAVPTAQGTVSNSGSPITFGPLKAGQIAMIYTEPRLRSVVDLSPDQPAQSLTAFQNLISTMVNAAVGAYPVPPLLQDLESVFGILPPQGPLYSLLNGRFTSLSQLPPKQDGYPPVTTYIPVSISGGNSASKIIAAATPYRTWPW
ncbi:hypothetical protein ACAG26_24380 [Mycobacterium sp. pUA109]|uniref:hypothetical protein n=1 Tax=Mycobacterium sp. pUA109 TaxID=3238982 RepID=UPI00351B9939